MDVQTPQSKERATTAEGPKPTRPGVPAIIVGVVIAAIASLSIWYLVRRQPLLVQGEVDATRLDIAARVDGRVAEIPVARGQNVAAGAVLVQDRQSRDDRQARAGAGRQGRRRGAARQYQRRHARRGHRGAQGRARAGASERGAGAKDLRPRRASWPSTATRRRRGSTRRPMPCMRASAPLDQAKSAYEQAVNGYTREEHRDRRGKRRQGGRRHQGRPIDHRSDGGLRAGRLAGLPAQRRAGRICLARRAAGHA